MKLKILLFGMLADRFQDQLEMELVRDTDSLKQKLSELDQAFVNIPFSIAVNKKIISQNQAIDPSDEIALLPPFAGG